MLYINEKGIFEINKENVNTETYYLTQHDYTYLYKNRKELHQILLNYFKVGTTFVCVSKVDESKKLYKLLETENL